MGLIAAIILAALIAKAASGSKPAPKDTAGPDGIKGTGDDTKVFDPMGPEKGYTLPQPPVPPPPVELGEKPPLSETFSSVFGGSALAPTPISGPWPGVQSLPEPWRKNALDALGGVDYAQLYTNQPSKICSSPFCSLYVIGTTHGLIAKERDLINSKYGGLGSTPIYVDLALKELAQAHEMVRKAGK